MVKRIPIKDEKELILRKNKSVTWRFSDAADETEKEYSLFFSCEDIGYAGIKHEGAGEKLYLYIDDSLNTEEAEKSIYCLDMSCCRPESFPKRAVKKVIWDPLDYGAVGFTMVSESCTDWKAGIYAKAENLKIESGGYLRLRIEQHRAKQANSPHFTGDSLIKTDFIEIDCGSYGYTVFEKALNLPEDLSCVIVTLEGENYSGNVYFEAPFITSASGYNVLPDFNVTLSGMEKFNWMGQNLSKREWPRVLLKINGKTFFDDEIFLHIHRFTPIEIEIPPDMVKDGVNEIELTYLSNYRDAVPLAVKEAYILVCGGRSFKVLANPGVAVKDGILRVLAETKKDNISFEFESDDFKLVSERIIKNKGLNIILLKPVKNRNNMTFSIGERGKSEKYTVSRLVRKTDDDIVCGSGDSIYINTASENDTKRFLKWYLSENIGNLFTVRQVYRWGGQRFVNKKVWDMFTALMKDAGIYYVLLSDGRDVGSIAANPSVKMLKGENFLGKQLHERDGQLFYWREDTGKPMEIESPMEEFYDLAMRLADENPETIEGAYRKFNVQYKDGNYCYFRNTECKSDMKEAYELASKHINKLRQDNFSRHTGPSVMFKYFYEQGFDFLGAETMDGATESLLAFLRGASKAYGKNRFGVHQALQWAMFPHDTKAHLRRYQVSLLISYMHGATVINTEEGLWFQEGCYSYHNRLSEVCESHKKVHQKFYKYVQTHSRTGRFYTKTAFIHGRYDGWNGFICDLIWGMDHMKTGSDGKSWELLKIFYPLNRVDKNGMSVFCYADDEASLPRGYFSGTPRGNVDVVPIENGNFDDYSLLIFAGYNMACREDMDRLYSAVKKGATLVCTWAHLSTNTGRESIDKNDFTVIDHPLTKALKDCGDDLIYIAYIGKGKIVLFNKMCYPGDDRICGDYKKLVESLCEEIAKEDKVRVVCGEDTGYTKYIQDDGSFKIYLTPVDWYNVNEEYKEAQIVIGKKSYPVKLTFGKITTVVCNDSTAAWTEDDESEILGLYGDKVELQGTGRVTLHIAGEKERVMSCDFDNNAFITVNY